MRIDASFHASKDACVTVFRPGVQLEMSDIPSLTRMCVHAVFHCSEGWLHSAAERGRQVHAAAAEPLPAADCIQEAASIVAAAAQHTCAGALLSTD